MNCTFHPQVPCLQMILKVVLLCLSAMKHFHLCGPIQDITSPKNKENSMTCRAWRYVECAFGIMSNKRRILHTALNVSKEFSKDIVKACVLLHNLVRSKDGYRSEEIYMTQNWNSVNRAACSWPRWSASDIQDRFADYFVSREGALPWQMNKL